jgi:protoporphyrinogen oxidase
MLNNKVVIVGSGIAGITAAYFEAKKGNVVTLIESDSRAGGLLKSDFTNNCYFDYGTHVLTQTGLPELDVFLFSQLNNDNCVITKKINAGSYFNGKMNHKNCYIDSIAIGVELFNQGCLELLASNNKPNTDNLEYFLQQKFGYTFYQKIYKPVVEKYIGLDPKELSVQVGGFFDLSRLLAFNDTVTKRLCSLEIYNSRLGHHKREDGVMKYYPRQGGIGKIVELLMEKLQQEKVDIKLLTNIKSINHRNGKVISLITENEEIKLDKLIWTLPSSYLSYLSKLEQKSQPPKFRNTGLYDFIFKEPLSPKAAFINVHDVDMYSGRITLYQNLAQNDNYSCTVEVLTDDGVDLNTLINKIHLELVKMGIVDKNNQCTFKQFRPIKNGFPILTTDFVKTQNIVNEYCENYFDNVMFLGRSTGKVFFMNDVLIDTYNKITND